MASCPHTGWVDIGRSGGAWYLHSNNRLQCLIRSLPAADEQFPSLFFFLGRKVKLAALKVIFPGNNLTRRQPRSNGNIHLDSFTAASVHPVILIDCVPTISVTQNEVRPSCHQHDRWPLTWTYNARWTSEQLLRTLTARLCLSFVDVVCIFVDDLGGIDDVAKVLLGWSEQPQLVQLQSRLKVILVGEAPTLPIVIDIGRTQRERIESLFDVEYCSLSDKAKLSDETLYLRIKAQMFRAADDVRVQRQRAHLHLNGAHLDFFFSKACEHFATYETEELNLLTTYPLFKKLRESDLTANVSLFLEYSAGAGVPWTDAARSLASALLVQAYTSRSHRE